MNAIVITSLCMLWVVSRRVLLYVIGLLLLLCGYLIVSDNRVLLLLLDHCWFNHCLFIVTKNGFLLTVVIAGVNRENHYERNGITWRY